MKRIYYILFLAALVFSCEKPISEFQSHNFIKFFGSGYESKGNDVIELSEGGYVITGYDKVEGAKNQVFVAKVDINGNLIWSKSWGTLNFDKEGKIVKEVSDGFLIAGTATGSNGIAHPFIFKISISGDSVWYNEFGAADHDIVINDLYVNSSTIYVAGQSDISHVNKTEYYYAKLDLYPDSAHLDWDTNNPAGSDYVASESYLESVFLIGDSILFVGTDGIEKNIAFITLLQSGGPSFEIYDAPDGSACDVAMVGNQLFVLANISGGMQLSKLNSSHVIDWQTELITSVTPKAVAYNEDGTLMVCGESIKDGNSLINFIKVDETGSVEYGPQSFRTLQGTVGKVLQTKDKGLILVGTTNPTFGASVQLIKTDKDYFMLKN